MGKTRKSMSIFGNYFGAVPRGQDGTTSVISLKKSPLPIVWCLKSIIGNVLTVKVRVRHEVNIVKAKHQDSKANTIHRMDIEPKTARVAVKELAGGDC